MKPANITQLLATYIHALHILHYHGVLDGYGHLSVRNPDNPATFFTIYQMAPALVSGLDDIGEYRVSDSERARPGNPDAKDTVERFIHGETLKRYPDVNVVLHGHAEEMVAYSISRVPLRAATHMSPIIGEEVPNFDITKFYRPNDTQDFLVRNQRLGAALAAEFDTSSNSNTYPRHNVVLMRSHGFAAVATDVKMATYEGIFALTNAKIEASALMLQHAYTGQAAQGRDGIAYLTPRQIYDSWQTERGIVDKPWALWVREVQVNPLYVNELDPDQ
ncbi:uncharacterized protein THITE_2040100 [Thermothielavioides terrestris NRRL 8126]|uniref:Class II aldolase/adducin N-terminal domain-containing protein n=1 Tax=Thermothielavioides terrestris (strain ATCC 38088 / NRRL 8126) TaxID=578455 RepID=G2QWL0_THETT|nr:uncharacterized protein THITE_2040100 [Thermothielavioides terrestris NRRL 8126]AEO64785.1 hypothetical protein THITE_2040100 [Thermothielavioides terrestris NRRL 8126]